MLYFENLPEIIYDEASARNIFNKLEIVSDLTEDVVQYYRVKDGHTIFHVAKEVYGDEGFWWLIALLNDMHDYIFEFPVSTELISELAKENTLQYLRISSTSYMNRNSFVGNTISYNGVTGKIVGKVSDGTMYYIKVKLDVPGVLFPTNTFFSVINTLDNMTILDFASSAALGIVGNSITQWNLDYIKKYEEMESENDSKRIISIIRPEYKNRVLSDIVQSIVDSTTIESTQTSTQAGSFASSGTSSGSGGKSAYEIAVENGFVGTVTEWLESLKGYSRTISTTGPTGIPVDGEEWIVVDGELV